MSVCLIRDGQLAYCLAINALNVAVFFSVGVFLNIAGNLIAGSIRKAYDEQGRATK